jgi:hypothetical protein
MPSARVTEATSTGSHKSVNSNVTKNKHESSDHQATKKPISNEEIVGEVTTKKTQAQKISEGSTTQKPTNQNGHRNSTLMFRGPKIAKTPILTESKALALPSDSDIISEVVKRNSEIKVFTSESGSNYKPVEIEVRSYTSPPSASAVIEVKPSMYNGYNTDFQNYPDINSWPGYQMYPHPQETNGPLNWYMDQYQQPVQPGLSYVPTEELLHSQSFSKNPSLSSHLLYQYPVKDSLYRNPITSLRPKLNHVQEIPSKIFDNRVVNSKLDSEYEYNSLQNYPVNPPALNSAYNLDTQRRLQYVVPQNDIQPYFLPDSNEIQNPLFINTEPESNYKPGLIKYVTKSYYLKTNPKLEWVPL